MSTSTWKIEKKTLQGLDTWVITFANGVSRFATEVEVDMWNQIVAATKTKAEFIEMLNKFGFKVEATLKAHTGKGIVDPDKIKADEKEAKAKADKDKAKAEEKAKADGKATPTKPAETPASTPAFGKRDAAPETLSLKERLLGKHRDKLKASASAAPAGGMAGPTGKLP